MLHPWGDEGRVIAPTSLDAAMRGQHAAEVWTRLRHRHMQRVEVLEGAVLALMDGALDEELRWRAVAEAHALAGSVGTFGVSGGARLARALEQSFAARYTLRRQMAARLADQVMALRRELERPHLASGAAPEIDGGRRVLVLTDDGRGDQFITEGVTAGIEVMVCPLEGGALASFDAAPDAIVIEAGDAALDAVVSLLGALAGRATGPVLVTTPLDGMAIRLAIAQSGAIGPLMAGHPPAAILERAIMALESRQAASASLVVADSDPYARQSAALMLEQAGHRVHTLDASLGFWETLDSVIPDLVVLGAGMSGVTGIDLCRALRADPRWRELPVVLMASADDAPLAKGAYHAGADDVVRKPLQREELIGRVENRLHRTRQLRREGEGDALTGLPGRKKAEREIDRFMQLARRHRHEVTFVTLRLDRYAEVVQGVGQAAMDAAVLAFTQVLRHSFRSEDVVSQWGPNEFVVALFDSNGANAAVRVRDVMTTLRVRRFPAPSGDAFSLTCSAGIASYPEDGADVRELHEAADAALVAAGNGGVDEGLGVACDPNSPATGRADILLVEDDAAVATLLVHALESRQYQVQWMRSGQAAASALLGGKPSLRARLILLEVSLPELDGLALLRSLAEQDVLRHTRVIVLSSRTTEAETVQAFELGAFDYVAKPFSVAVLTERIRRALRA